jgi:hypothetical protein
MTPGRIGSVALVAAAGLVCASFAITLGRAPSPWPDAQLYAAIARSLETHGSGVPSTIWFSPAAVDHLPFYGPVYFELTALAFAVLGFSIESSKLAGLLGVVLVASATALLARSLSGEKERWLLAVSLVLMTPEIGAAATSGDMETFAVGLELMALAAYVRGILQLSRPGLSGALAGSFLLLAALTTPRTFPFVVAFLAVGGVVAFVSHLRSNALTQLAVAIAVFAAGFVTWTIGEHGGPLQWAGNVRFILTREDADVAVLETANRALAFNWSSAMTPAAVLLGATLAARYAVRQSRREDDAHVAAAFALATTAAAGIAIVWGMNITFSLGMYFALPAFAVVLALPQRWFGLPPPAMVALVSIVLAFDVASAAVRVARIAATWEARDPEPVTEFLRRHVPADSSVVGPNALYFFPVEAIGAHYRSFAAESHADWARWATSLHAFAPPSDRGPRPDPQGERFFILQSGHDLPAGYACAEYLTSYQSPPHYLHRLGPFSSSWDIGFPSTDLYTLPSTCPVGYDPTGTRAE